MCNFTQRWFRKESTTQYEYGDPSYPDMGCYTCDHCEMPIAAIIAEDPREGFDSYWPERVGQGLPRCPWVNRGSS
jgi:hypothetical protein